MALPFAPETFGIRPSTEVGDHLDATAESLGQRRDCDPPTHRRAREDASIRSVRRDVALRAGEVTALAPPRDENRLRHELRCFAIAAASRCPRASHPWPSRKDAARMATQRRWVDRATGWSLAHHQPGDLGSVLPARTTCGVADGAHQRYRRL